MLLSRGYKKNHRLSFRLPGLRRNASRFRPLVRRDFVSIAAISDEACFGQTNQRQGLAQLIQVTTHAAGFPIAITVIVPEKESAFPQHAQRFLCIVLDVRVCVRAINKDQVALFQIRRFVESFAVAE